jgi:hypothetical protein
MDVRKVIVYFSVFASMLCGSIVEAETVSQTDLVTVIKSRDAGIEAYRLHVERTSFHISLSWTTALDEFVSYLEKNKDAPNIGDISHLVSLLTDEKLSAEEATIAVDRDKFKCVESTDGKTTQIDYFGGENVYSL